MSSSKAIRTVNEFWYEGCRSRIALEINPNLINWTETDEQFFTIEFFEHHTGIKIGEFPITIINDRPFDKFLSLDQSIGVEDGARIHLFPSENVKGLIVSVPYSMKRIQGILSIYNPNGQIQKRYV